LTYDHLTVWYITKIRKGIFDEFCESFDSALRRVYLQGACG
jgi:hypothetical protein